MVIGSAFEQGIYGLQQSQRDMIASAQRVVGESPFPRANGVGETVDTGLSVQGSNEIFDAVSPLVDMRMQQHVFDASANVIKIADETLGALIDTRA